MYVILAQKVDMGCNKGQIGITIMSSFHILTRDWAITSGGLWTTSLSRRALHSVQHSNTVIVIAPLVRLSHYVRQRGTCHPVKVIGHIRRKKQGARPAETRAEYRINSAVYTGSLRADVWVERNGEMTPSSSALSMFCNKADKKNLLKCFSHWSLDP